MSNASSSGRRAPTLSGRKFVSHEFKNSCEEKLFTEEEVQDYFYNLADYTLSRSLQSSCVRVSHGHSPPPRDQNWLD